MLLETFTGKQTMRMTFRGWQREVVPHEHAIIPVALHDDTFTALGKPHLQWEDTHTAYGKMEEARLSGSFLVKFEFEEAELVSWLRKYAEAQPARALGLVADIQAKALIALAERHISME